MKRVLSFALLVLVIISFLSCDNIVDSETTTRKARMVSIEKVEINNNTVTILALAEWPNGCGKFSHYAVNRNKKNITVSVYGSEPQNAVCTQAIIQFVAPITIMVDQPGLYNFHFWQTETTSMDTSFTI